MVSERLYKRWINGLWAGERIAADLVSPDFVGHWPTRDVHGPAELQAIVDETRAALKELLFVVEVGPIIDGDIVAALLDQEATVKVYRRDDAGVWLLPRNQAYAPIDGSHARIMGKVVAVLRRL